MKCKTSYGERDLFLMDRKKGIRYGRDSRGEAFYIGGTGKISLKRKEKTRRCEDAWEGS